MLDDVSGEGVAVALPRPNPSGRSSGIGWLVRRGSGRCAGVDRIAKSLQPGQDPALAVVETLLDVEREQVAAPGRANPEGDRHRVIGLVADGQRDASHAELAGRLLGPTVEDHGRLAGREPLDLDLLPADAAHPEPQHLAHCFLGRPAAGERLRPIADVTLLARGQNAAGEAGAELGERVADPGHLDDVDPDLGGALWHLTHDGFREDTATLGDVRGGPPGSLPAHRAATRP